MIFRGDSEKNLRTHAYSGIRHIDRGKNGRLHGIFLPLIVMIKRIDVPRGDSQGLC